MNIEVRDLTTFKIGDDGQSVALTVIDSAGLPATLNLQFSQLGVLAMTLPSLIETAMRRQYGDDSLRFAYPMGSWTIEQSTDPKTLILTMRTTDGFGVSFSLPRAKAEDFSQAITAGVNDKVEMVTH